MKTKSNNNPSKLQSEAVKGLMELKETLIYDAEVSDEDAERDAENQIKQFLSDQIQKAYEAGELYLLKNYSKWWAEWRADWSHKLEYPDNSDALDFYSWIKKYKLSIQSKGK